AAREGYDLVAAGSAPRNLQSGFHGGRRRRTGVMHAVVPATRAQKIAADGVGKAGQRDGRLGNTALFLQTAPQHLHQERVVVPVVQRTGCAAEIDILTAAGIREHGAVGACEEMAIGTTREIPDMGLDTLKNAWFDHGLLPWQAWPVVRVPAPVKPLCPIPVGRRLPEERPAWEKQLRCERCRRNGWIPSMPQCVPATA